MARFLQNFGIDMPELASGAITLIVISVILVLVLSIVAWCILFSKAGKPAGFLFIPVYGLYCQYEIADSTGLFFVTLAVNILQSILVLFARNAEGAIATITLIALVITMIVSIVFMVRLARAFGRSGGFAVGLIFLPTIFLCILAFGSSEHYTAVERRRMREIHAQRQREREERTAAALQAPSRAALPPKEEDKKKDGKKGKKKDKKKDKEKDKKKDKKKGKKKDKD